MGQHDQHYSDINHLISDLQLGNLSRRHDRDVNDLVGEVKRWNLWDLNGFLNDLQQWDLNVPGHLVDLFMDNVFLHCSCVDDLLNARVHTLLRLSLRLNDRHHNYHLSK